MKNENNDSYFQNIKAIYQSKSNQAKSRNHCNSYINAGTSPIR
jgi:hypothetical protein